MPHDSYRALYLHIPYCVKRCDYCDFTTWAVDAGKSSIDEYVDDLVLQIRRKAKEGELTDIQTVYIGGGTPSHIGLSRLSSLLYALSLSMRLEPDVECTMEANPESLTPQMVKDVWALGVNRLSLGVQSFDDDVLRILGRAHDADCAKAAIRQAQERFSNVSIDLMCGIPGQTMESFRRSLHEAVSLGLAHISIYPLTIEKGTLFAKAYRKGKLPPLDEDAQADMMEVAQRLLEDAGYHRYEVASYAKPGFECRHNIAYWTGVPYLGLGVSAATMTQNGERRMRVKDGFVTDDLNRQQMAAEDLMLGMRMSCGVSEQQIQEASELLPKVVETFQGLIDLGLADAVDGRVVPTQLGWLCGNELYGRIFDLAE